MKKIWIGTGIFCISTSIFAFQMMSEETRISPNINGYIEKNNYIVGKITPELKKSINKFDMGVKTYDINGKLNTYIKTLSTHEFCLYNDSEMSTQGGYHFELAVLGETMFDSKTFLLDKNEYFCTSLVIFNLYVLPTQIGSFEIKAITRGKDGNFVKEMNDHARLTIEA